MSLILEILSFILSAAITFISLKKFGLSKVYTIIGFFLSIEFFVFFLVWMKKYWIFNLKNQIFCKIMDILNVVYKIVEEISNI